MKHSNSCPAFSAPTGTAALAILLRMFPDLEEVEALEFVLDLVRVLKRLFGLMALVIDSNKCSAKASQNKYYTIYTTMLSLQTLLAKLTAANFRN